MKFCPNCGAQADPNDNFCTRCGSRISTSNQPITNPINNFTKNNEPNLIISYTSINASIMAILVIKSLNVRLTMLSGQTLTFHLPEGEHRIVLKIGRTNHNIPIYILPSNQTVRINGSFTGRPQVHIDQPSYK